MTKSCCNENVKIAQAESLEYSVYDWISLGFQSGDASADEFDFISVECKIMS